MYTNPLRVLDSKNPDGQALLNDAPALGDYLDEESKAHFAGLCALLDDAGIATPSTSAWCAALITITAPCSRWVTTSLGSQAPSAPAVVTTAWLSNWAVALPRAWSLPWGWNVLFYWSRQ